jgi:ankyrin repeat protein
MIIRSDAKGFERALLVLLLMAAVGLFVSKIWGSANRVDPKKPWYTAGMKFEEVNRKLDNGADPNGPTGSPLSMAIGGNDVRMAELLLQRGADVSKDNYSALTTAARISDGKVLRMLLAKGCPKEALDRALVRVSSSSYGMPNARLLLEAGADPNRGDFGYTLLHQVCSGSGGGPPEFAKMLIERGARTDIPNIDNQTPLFLACNIGRKDLVKLLLAARKGSSVPGNPGFMEACVMGDANAIGRYIANGCNPNSFGNKVPYYPLSLAAQSGSVDAVKLLVSRGAKVNTSKHGDSPLNAAARNGDTEVIGVLLAAGADPNFGGRGASEPLLTAISGKQRKAALLLLKAGATMPASDWQGAPPLTTLVNYHNVDGLRIYLECGGPLNSVGPIGETALMRAAQRNDEEVVKLLIKAGADRFIRDKRGRTAAQWTKRLSMIDLLNNFNR